MCEKVDPTTAAAAFSQSVVKEEEVVVKWQWQVLKVLNRPWNRFTTGGVFLDSSSNSYFFSLFIAKVAEAAATLLEIHT